VPSGAVFYREITKSSKLFNLSVSSKSKNNKNIKRKSKIDILVIRSVPNGIGSSKPCQHCLHIMKQLNVNRVFYSIDGNEVICEKVKYMTSTHLSLGGKMVKKSKESFKDK
jgi:hypothetical protein